VKVAPPTVHAGVGNALRQAFHLDGELRSLKVSRICSASSIEAGCGVQLERAELRSISTNRKDDPTA
jgi:hypothetical protein